jgi:hypothetical protein
MPRHNAPVYSGPRVDHVVWCVRRESLPELERYWTDALQVPLASFQINDLGIRVLMSWDAGVEIIAPAEEPGSFTAALNDFLNAKGEGVFSTVYEVDDLNAAVQQAKAAGAEVTFEDVIEADTLAERLGWPSGRQSYRLRQAVLVERFGTTVCLQESRPA